MTPHDPVAPSSLSAVNRKSTGNRGIFHRTCTRCGSAFVTLTENKIFCGERCSHLFHAGPFALHFRREIETRITAGRRRERIAGAQGDHSDWQWFDQCERFDWKCGYCRTELTEKTATKDHFVALVNGGTNYIWNIVPACRSCNLKKRDRDAISTFSQHTTTAVIELLADAWRVGRVPDDPGFHLNKWRTPEHVWSLRETMLQRQLQKMIAQIAAQKSMDGLLYPGREVCRHVGRVKP
jgi:HNH endonuclease